LIYHNLINLIKVVLDRRESPQILFEYDWVVYSLHTLTFILKLYIYIYIYIYIC
jgi:hypothetical protein